MTSIVYDAPPTCAKFMKSDAFGRLIAGPVGSGKTTACLFELFRRSCEQAPDTDGIRRTRFAIVRQTLKQLKDTVLKDITGWLDGAARYKVSDNTVYIEIGDVRSEWILIPLDDPEDQRRLLSMQLTGAWMSECIEMDLGLVAPLSGRCGRFPKNGATWFGIVADTNMPPEGSDWHKFMTEEASDWQVFIQPSGMSDEAENLEYLLQTPETRALSLDTIEGRARRRAQGRTYYERFVRSYGETSDWVKRYVYAEFGDDPSGSAVFRETFKRGFHVTQGLLPVVGHPIIVGQDFGRDPWSIIGQVDHMGRLLILKEVKAEDIGLEAHVQRALRPALMDERFLGRPVAVIGDPAGVAKGNIYEETSFDALKRMGFSAFPAPTNQIDARIRAVDAWLGRAIGGAAGMLIDEENCPELVRALSGGYRYGKTKGGQRKPLPEKNKYSHPVDALQYLCLVAQGRMSELVSRHLSRKQPTRSGPLRAAAWT